MFVFTISSLTFDSVALGGSDWSGTQAGDATGSLIDGHRFTLHQALFLGPLWPSVIGNLGVVLYTESN